MYTSLKKIRCQLQRDPASMSVNGERFDYIKLRQHVGPGEGREFDDAPISLATVVDCLGLDAAVRCMRTVDPVYDGQIRMFAVWCVKQVDYLCHDKRCKFAMYEAQLQAKGWSWTKAIEFWAHRAGESCKAAAYDIKKLTSQCSIAERIVMERSREYEDIMAVIERAVLKEASYRQTLMASQVDAIRRDFKLKASAPGCVLHTAWKNIQDAQRNFSSLQFDLACAKPKWHATEAARATLHPNAYTAAANVVWFISKLAGEASERRKTEQALELKRVCACVDAGHKPYPEDLIPLRPHRRS